MASDTRLQKETGNTLVLVPVAILLVFGLGAVALDSATLFLGQRRLADLAAAVADDAATTIDRDAFYSSTGDVNEIALDPVAAQRRAEQLVALARDDQDRSLADIVCVLEVTGNLATATCTAVARPIMVPMWPGLGSEHQLRSTGTAVGVTDP